MRGKWAEGIQPRNFCWVVADRLAVCERPGGYGASHRRVRRQEEIIWLRRNGFDMVVSLIAAPHNLHNYDELDLRYLHRPWPAADDLPSYLQAVHDDLSRLNSEPKRVVLHKERVGEDVCGFVASYLLLSGKVPTGPQATAITERIFGRRVGPDGRRIVDVALGILAARGSAGSPGPGAAI